MEEKNQNTNEYTGEYGNPVERNDAAGQEPEKEQESSVYSYSYRDHKPEATSSGDYHASDNTADASEKQDSMESNAADSGYTHTDNTQSQSADPRMDSRERDGQRWESSRNAATDRQRRLIGRIAAQRTALRRKRAFSMERSWQPVQFLRLYLVL
ncbi:hypothetical protein [Roseburia sp. AM59-24XD]|uniref:hypothetical protein n=1 Tax=Roseburia sp. AM59-24XD TaxID=2293138 RepID=UPI001FAABDE6|nr:hypothetical protein [Roseburia sp. AM59-24XD]